MASSGKGKSPARRVEMINFLDYNDSDNEEDSLHYHHNNRIKASKITKADFVYFTNSQSEEVSSSELENGNLWRTRIAKEKTRMMTGIAAWICQGHRS